METKVVQIGSSLGVVLPIESLKQFNVKAGDILDVTADDGVLHVSVKEPDTEKQMAEATEVMNRRAAVLRELAK